MREGALIEYTGPIEPYIIHPDELDITPESKETKVPMRILQEDDGSIAGRGTIPLDSISSIKEDRRIYHVFGRILDKEEYFLRKIIRIADNSGEIGYHFQSDTFDKVKVGDRIDVIGRCSLNEYGTASLSSALSGSDVIHLSASDQEI
jgi:hypothetical protein